MSPTSYQIQHPWHWLTYGNNAAAIASISAILGLIGLFLYVWDTRSITDATLASLQTEIYPVLFAHWFDIKNGMVHWRVSNLGRGPARNVSVWRIEEGNNAASLFKRRQVLPKNERAIIYGTLMPNHLPDDAFQIRYAPANGEDAFLVIVDAEDNAGNWHQLQILSYSEMSSRGRLAWESYHITTDRKRAMREKRKNTRTFIHGKGADDGVDLNLYEIDGTPYRHKGHGLRPPVDD